MGRNIESPVPIILGPLILFMYWKWLDQLKCWALHINHKLVTRISSIAVPVRVMRSLPDLIQSNENGITSIIYRFKTYSTRSASKMFLELVVLVSNIWFDNFTLQEIIVHIINKRIQLGIRRINYEWVILIRNAPSSWWVIETKQTGIVTQFEHILIFVHASLRWPPPFVIS